MSTPGGGSTFTLYLPLSPEEPKGAWMEPLPAAPTVQLPSMPQVQLPTEPEVQVPTVPQVQVAVPEVAPTLPQPAAPVDLERLEGKKILVVEDDVRNLYVLSSFLERHKAIPVPALNANEAFARLKEHPDVALILMDIMLPEMDGVQATKQIRAMPGFGNVPVIAHTAKASESERAQCLAAGLDDYISKPADIRQLAAVLVRNLRSE
ncbi:MAG: response regulator [Myxococcaceae bacterium]|nr:response regulator [Myxococcaceae bacterium]